MMKVTQEQVGERLDRFLSDFLANNRTKAQQAIEKGYVLVNGVKKKSSYRLRENDEVEFNKNFENESTEVPAQEIPLNIVYEDEHLLVVNKPKNMLTHPTSYDSQNTLVNALLFHCKGKLSDIGGELRRGIVHRLDKNTPGLLMVAKTNEAHESLAKQIKEKSAKRRYLAVVVGEVKEDKGTIDKPISRSLKESVKMVIDFNSPSAKKARTHYRVLERFCGCTFLELELETGRTHQIRVHLASLNHPVFGDELYGAKGFRQCQDIKTNGQVLQSVYLGFIHPINSKTMEFKLEDKDWDKDLKRVLRLLKIPASPS